MRNIMQTPANIRPLAFAAALTVAGLVLANMAGAAQPTPAQLLTGTWSFDGTCASGDGMTLNKDGKASYDEWGTGLWAVTDKGTRIVLIIEDTTEEADRRKVATLEEFRIHSWAGKTMAIQRFSDGAKISAVKCM
jgi:hypothetical protein